MIETQSIADVFTLLYELTKPVLLVLGITFFFLPKALSSSASPGKVAQAFFGYTMEAVGVVLMSVSAINTLIAVLDSAAYSAESYLSLVLIFATGGILFLWSDQQVRSIEDIHRVIPGLIFSFALKIVGYLAVVFACLSIAWAIALGVILVPGWWISPLVLLGYGLLLTWLTAGPTSQPWSAATREVKKEESVTPIRKTTTKKRTTSRKKK